MFGCLIALAVYGYTFGHYAAHLFGLPEAFANGFAILILLVFLGINLRGVGAWALSEDLVVLLKIAILALIAAIGFAHFSPERLAPLADKGTAGVIVASASIFVAYEGFELVSYDYDDLERPRWTLPRALYLSVAIVTVVYVTVTIGAQMLVSDGVVVAQNRIALAHELPALFGRGRADLPVLALGFLAVTG